MGCRAAAVEATQRYRFDVKNKADLRKLKNLENVQLGASSGRF
jgi:hypothetical protein